MSVETDDVSSFVVMWVVGNVLSFEVVVVKVIDVESVAGDETSLVRDANADECADVCFSVVEGSFVLVNEENVLMGRLLSSDD